MEKKIIIIFISYSIFIICDFHHEDNSISQCIRRMSSFWQTDTWQLENPLTEKYFVRWCFYLFFYGLMRLLHFHFFFCKNHLHDYPESLIKLEKYCKGSNVAWFWFKSVLKDLGTVRKKGQKLNFQPFV